MKKTYITIGVLSLVFLFAGSYYKQSTTPEAKQKSKYIDFELYDISSKKVKLSNFVGKKIVLINFWTTWCPYCVREIPDLKLLYNTYKNNGFEIIGVNLGETSNTVKRFTEKNKIDYMILLDENNSVGSLYQVRGIPTNILIDFDGNIVFYGNSLPSKDLINQYFQKK